MGTLAGRFFEAAHTWSVKKGDPEEIAVASWIMVFTGGSGHYEPVGKVDPLNVPLDQRQRLTVGQLRGTHTVAQAREWLDRLATQGLSEAILIPGLVLLIRAELKRLCDEYPEAVKRSQGFLAYLRGLAADPEQRAAYLREMSDPEHRGRWQSLGIEPEPLDEVGLQRVIEFVAGQSVFSLEELRSRQQALDSWEQLTAPLLDLATIGEAAENWLRSLAQH